MARNGYAGGFLDLTRLLGGVIGSYLVWSGCNSFARVFKLLYVSITYNITHGMLKMSIKVTDSERILARNGHCGVGPEARSAEGLEASARAQRVCLRITRRGILM